MKKIEITPELARLIHGNKTNRLKIIAFVEICIKEGVILDKNVSEILANILSKNLSREPMDGYDHNYPFKNYDFETAMRYADALLEPDRSTYLVTIYNAGQDKGTMSEFQVIEMLSQKAKAAAWKELVDNCIKYENYDYLFAAAQYFPETEKERCIKLAVEGNIRKGNLEEAEKQAKTISREITAGDLEIALTSLIQSYSFNKCLEVAKRIGRKLTDPELEHLIKRGFEYNGGKSLDGIIELLSEPKRSLHLVML